MSQLLEEASQSESIARLANLPAPVKRLTTSSQGSSLEDQEQARIRQALIVSLRRKTDVRITLPKLEPPVLPVDTRGDRHLGPDHAPITIVEFSDFECPYCRQSAKILKELRQLYGNRIQVVYRDYLGPKESFGSTTICCLTINRWVMDGILRCWQRSWDCNRMNSRSVCSPVDFGSRSPRTCRMD